MQPIVHVKHWIRRWIVLVRRYPWLWFYLTYVRRFMAMLRTQHSFSETQATVYVDMAQVWIDLGKLEDAKRHCLHAIALAPNHAAAHYEMGRIERFMGQFEQAVKWFESAIALKPNWLEAYLEAGATIHRSGRIDQALPFWQKAMDVQQHLSETQNLANLQIRYLTQWTSVIGHLALLDFYVKAKQLGWQTHQYIVLAPPDEVVNPCYLDYWRSHLTVISDPVEIGKHQSVAQYLSDRLPMLPLNSQWLWMLDACAKVQHQWETESRPPLLNLTASDQERGWQALQTVGIGSNHWFVCLHVREAGFHQQSQTTTHTLRNAHIDTYRLAIQQIVDQGGWVIRMGDPSMQPLEPMAGLFDYAHSSLKSDWMDVFLCASCRFFIGTNSGLCFVSSTFGVPCVLTNWAPLGEQSWYGQDIMIPKRLWSAPHQRYLNFEEMFAPPFGYHGSGDGFANLGVHCVDNTATELSDVVNEMLARLNGRLTYTAKEEALQMQFRQVAARAGITMMNRIGQSFLANWADLLPQHQES